jgi:hypothetical protein
VVEKGLRYTMRLGPDEVDYNKEDKIVEVDAQGDPVQEDGEVTEEGARQWKGKEVVREKDEEFLRQAVSCNHRLVPTPSTWPNGLLRLNGDGKRWLQDWWWYACRVTYQGGPEQPLCDNDPERSMTDGRGPEWPLYDGDPEWSKTDGQGPERPSHDGDPERSKTDRRGPEWPSYDGDPEQSKTDGQGPGRQQSKTDRQGSRRPSYYGDPERSEANGQRVKTPTFYAMRRGDGGREYTDGNKRGVPNEGG